MEIFLVYECLASITQNNTIPDYVLFFHESKHRPRPLPLPHLPAVGESKAPSAVCGAQVVTSLPMEHFS